MTRRHDRLQSEVGTFMKQYNRGGSYDPDVEREIKRMSPWELDELLNGGDIEEFEEEDALLDDALDLPDDDY